MDEYSDDTNADGVGVFTYVDFTYFDSNADDGYDTVQIDTDGDGYVDTVTVDVNQDGTPEAVISDLNEDGIDDATQTGSWLDAMDNPTPTDQAGWTTSGGGAVEPHTGNWGDNPAADWLATSNAALQGYGGVYYGAESPWG